MQKKRSRRNISTAKKFSSSPSLSSTAVDRHSHMQPQAKISVAAPPSTSLPSATSLSVADQPTSEAVASPFALGDGPLAACEAVPQRWLWPGRIPLGTITLLDGDLGCGKSLLSQQIAAHVSAGTTLPDGSATIQGGVVMITPYEDARKAMVARLKANGADLNNIYVISFVHDRDAQGAPLPHDYHPFMVPNDIEVLRETMRKANARLVIIDPFFAVLPTKARFYQSQLQRILLQLHQLMIEMDATCLLIRQCPAKGGEARPSALERSVHFANIAASRLLVARDPMEPEHFLLTQVACRIQALAPTISFSITSSPQTPHLPHIIYEGSHPLRSHDLLTLRPGTLHSMLLGQRICELLATASEPVSLDTLRERFPRSTSSQVQRTVRRLVQEKALTRLARGLYTHGEAKTTRDTDTPLAS